MPRDGHVDPPATGFWTLTSVKVELTSRTARDRPPSSPRWELDIVAYRGRDHELRVLPKLRDSVYENSVAAVVTKLRLKDRGRPKRTTRKVKVDAAI